MRTIHLPFIITAMLCMMVSCERDTASRRWKSHSTPSDKPVVEYVLREEISGAVSLESLTMKGADPRSGRMEERKFDILNQKVEANTIQFEIGQVKGAAFTLRLPENLGQTFESQLAKADKVETVTFRQVEK